MQIMFENQFKAGIYHRVCPCLSTCLLEIYADASQIVFTQTETNGTVKQTVLVGKTNFILTALGYLRTICCKIAKFILENPYISICLVLIAGVVCICLLLAVVVGTAATAAAVAPKCIIS